MPSNILPKSTSRLDRAEELKRSEAVTVQQPSGSWRAVWFLTAVISLAVVGSLGLYSMTSNDVGMDAVMRDATAVSGASPFTAFGSDLGMYGWVCALAIGVMSLMLAARHGGAGKAVTRYLLGLLGLTLMLFLDDRMMLHEHAERVSSAYELVVMGALAFFGLAFFVAGARWHHLGGWPLLLTSIGLFALSIVVDQVSSPEILTEQMGSSGYSIHYLLEDGFKLAGIFFWLVFSARVAMQAVTRAERNSRKREQAVSAGSVDDPAAS